MLKAIGVQRDRRLGTANACLRRCERAAFLQAGGLNHAFGKQGEWALYGSSEDQPNEPWQEGQVELLKARMGEGEGPREASWHGADGDRREDFKNWQG